MTEAEDKAHHPGGGGESEMWRYKVQVENKSLSDLSGVEARYTLYLSPSSSRDKNASTRTVTGTSNIGPITRGNSVSFETIASEISSGGGRQGGPPGGGGGGQGGPPEGGGQGGPGGGAPTAEKLDGIKVELYIGETKVGEYIYGNAAKKAARDEKRAEKKAQRSK